MRRPRSAALMVCAAALAAIPPAALINPVAAQTTAPEAASPPTSIGALANKACGLEAVYANGEPASFEWLARIKTHANWRAKVRVLPGLGDAYANWELAENVTERCFSGPDGTVCQFTGVPCRRS